jgi:hypothetical protein
MPIHLYNKSGEYYISLTPVPNKGFRKVKKYKNININNSIYLNYSDSITYPILNTILVPTRLGYIVIINTKTKELRHFGNFDVLKDYKIEGDEIPFVIFYINNAIKIHSGRFDIRRSYKICTGCHYLYVGIMKVCNTCGEAICERCENPLDERVCNNCDPIFDTSSDDSGSEDDLFGKVMMEL